MLGCAGTAGECGIGGIAASWFLRCARMRARPAGPAQSSALHYSARSGPTEEAHRRALNQSGGLQRLTSTNGPRPAPAAPHPLRDPSREGLRDPSRGRSRDPWRDPTRELLRCQEVAPQRSGASFEIAPGNSTSETALGPKSASARPGPCPRPRSADAFTRREYHPARQRPASRSYVLGRRRRRPGTARRPAGGLRALQLDPGSGRMVPVTRVGRSARRAAAPAGRGRCRTGDQRRWWFVASGAAADGTIRRTCVSCL
jgi:hypothetical protein